MLGIFPLYRGRFMWQPTTAVHDPYVILTIDSPYLGNKVKLYMIV